MGRASKTLPGTNLIDLRMSSAVFLVFSITWQIKERTIFGRNDRIVGENVSDGESTAATSIDEGEARRSSLSFVSIYAKL